MSIQQKTPTIFLSYSWDNQQEAERIYVDLKAIGIDVKKDNYELKYKDNIKSFMESIRDADYALILISERYLKSKNCMYESLQLLKERDIHSKILPVIIDNTNIFKTEDRIEYIKYWDNQKQLLSESLKQLDPTNALESYNDLKIISDITSQIDAFIKQISIIKNITLSELKENHYAPIMSAIGYTDLTWAVDLITIVQMPSDSDKEIALDDYLTRHQPNTHFYSIKAGVYRRSGKTQQAKSNYLLAIKLKPENLEALNNLGQVYERLKEYEKAKDCYEKAIKAKYDFTVARLNLGVLLSNKFQDYEASKTQYEIILDYNPNEEKAHNNIANYYKTKFDGNDYSEKIIYHLEKAIAINPNYVEPHLGYANFFKLRKETERGNALYRKAKELDKEGNYTEIIDSLLNSTIG